ncbi:MAG: hypothetical protein H0V84_12275 [Actinobacteria bacterium]|nr:hypothetical protein [Actinomycetota bacterium]
MPLLWLASLGCFGGAVALVALGDCDSDGAARAAVALAAATGILAGAAVLYDRGRPATGALQLVGAVLAALVVAVPLGLLTFVVVIVLAAIRCTSYW